MNAPTRTYSERDLRAVDAVSLGLIGAGTLGLFLLLQSVAPGVGRSLLLYGAIVLSGVALHLGVLREQARSGSPGHAN